MRDNNNLYHRNRSHSREARRIRTTTVESQTTSQQLPKATKQKHLLHKFLLVSTIIIVLFLWIGILFPLGTKPTEGTNVRIKTILNDEQLLTPIDDTEIILKKKWKGDAYGGDPSHFRRIFLIISHCDESLHWLEEFTRGYEEEVKTTIYSKCNSSSSTTLKNAPRGSTIIKLPNVGRCDHTYAHWMANIPPSTINDDDAIVFLKGGRVIHQNGRPRTLGDMLRIASVNGFGCWLEPTNAWRHPKDADMSAYHDTDDLLTFKKVKYTKKRRDKRGGFKSQFKNLGDWLQSVNGSLPQPLTQVCYGGVFAVEASRIKEKGSIVWSRIEKSLSRGDNIAEGHYAERSWAGLLSHPLTTDEAQALENYRNFGYARKTPYYGAMLRVIPIWKGDVHGGDPNNFHRIFLVISHCNESLDWVNTFTKGFDVHNITVYSKCQAIVKDAPQGATVVQLPKVGQWHHAYAHWMAHMPSAIDDNDVIIFMTSRKTIRKKARPRSLSEMLRIASVNGFGCRFEPVNNTSSYHDTQLLKVFHRNNVNKVNGFESNVRSVGDWLKSIGGSLPEPLTQVCLGSIFVVKASHIKRKGPALWSSIETSLSRGDDIEENHYAERTWAGLLSDEPTAKDVKDLQMYKFNELKSGPYCGALYH